jgi:uncharacterized integral membrane protein
MMPKSDRPHPSDASSGFRPSGRQILGGVIAVVLIVFIAVNADDTSVNLIVKKVTMPLWVVLAGTALLGVLVGIGVGTRRTKRKYMTV